MSLEYSVTLENGTYDKLYVNCDNNGISMRHRGMDTVFVTLNEFDALIEEVKRYRAMLALAHEAA